MTSCLIQKSTVFLMKIPNVYAYKRFCGTHFVKSLDPLFGILSKFSHKIFEMINTYLDCNFGMNCM